MLEIIIDLPEQILGVRASGKITADDYREVLIPAVEKRLASHAKVRLLYVIGDDFDSFSGGAAWEDAKVGMSHFTSFDRVAVVSDNDWIEGMVKAFGFALPGEVRTFDNDEYEDARSWICEMPSKGKLEFEFIRDKGVLLLEPKDELEAADFARVAAEIDPYIEESGGLAGLVVIAKEFPGWDNFAALTSHFKFVREHHSKIRRVALVTTDRFLSAMPRFASRFVAAEIRRFSMEERDAALLWAAESD
jgi:hypothetical protein